MILERYVGLEDIIQWMLSKKTKRFECDWCGCATTFYDNVEKPECPVCSNPLKEDGR